MKLKEGIICLFICIGCAYEKNTPIPIASNTNPDVIIPHVIIPTTNIICSPDTIYFKQKILPLIVSNCAQGGCHDAISKRDGVQLTDYTSIIKYVKAGDPKNSKLYKSMIETGEDQMPPPPTKPFDTTTLATVFTWIKQGAINNGCEASGTGCITANMSYAKDIVPILQRSCTGCHGGTNPSAGIDLSSHAKVVTYVTNGKLYGSIAHLTGFKPMPNASTVIATCEISQIKSWIDAGARNN